MKFDDQGFTEPMSKDLSMRKTYEKVIDKKRFVRYKNALKSPVINFELKN